jgi:HEAT repeat protein
MLLRVLILYTLLVQQSDPARQARELIEKLRSEKVDERDEAAQKLKEFGKAAIPELEKASKDKDAEVARRAESLLRVIPIREKLTPNLLKTIPGIEDRLVLTDDHTWTLEFLRATENENGASRYPTLGTKDLDCLVSHAIRGWKTDKEMKQVFDAVEQKVLRSAAPEIVRHLEDQRQPVRFDAVQLLGKLGVKEAIPKIIPLLNDENEAVRALAAEALGSLGGKDAIPALLGALRGTDVRLREQAAAALGQLHAKEAVPELVTLLESGDPKGRSSAARALQTLRASETISDLVVRLKDTDPHVRSEVLRALASLKAKDTIADIARLLTDPDQTVRRAAAAALADLGAKDKIKDIAALLDEEGMNSVWVRGDAARALAKLDAREAIPKLAKLLSDEGGYARYMGAEALGKLGAKDHADQIAGLLGDKDWMAVNGALRALSELVAKDKIPAIVGTLKSKNAAVRSTAIWTLEWLEAKDQTLEIAKLLSDPSVQVRLAASEALCFMGAREGVPTLLKECADLSWPIREAGGTVFIGKSPRALNALRERDAWMRIRKVLVPVELEGTRKGVVEKAANDAGFTMDWSSSISPDDDPWISDLRRLSRSIKKWTLLDELGPLAQGQSVGNKSPRYEVIIEADRIRIVTYDEALQFWSSWWKAEEEKGK